MTLHESTASLGKLALCVGSCLLTSAWAETLTYEATADFPVIDAGEVPYYSEAPGRKSLAINAAIENNRNKFARATMVYEGSSGFFDITLTTLAELDGEAPYRVFVNDVLAGSAINPEVTVDYTEIRHTFEDIVVPEGAIIAVESLANTNGKIPEGDGTAFARGRWTTLELDDNDTGTPSEDTIDLSVSSSTSAGQAVVGESYLLTVDIRNAVDSAVATQPVLILTRPRGEVGVDTDTLENCTDSGNDVTCNFSEIPAEGNTQLSLTLQALEPSPSALLRVTVSADQTDSDPSNNSITLPLQIDAAALDPGEATDPVTVTEIDTGDGTTAPETTSGETLPSNRSGGGAGSEIGLILLSVFARRHLRRQRIQPDQD